jgi:virginiamycin B lyase
MKNAKAWKVVIVGLVLIVVTGAAAVLLPRAAVEAAQTGNAVIRGRVLSLEGAPLYGILVRARGEGKNYTTSVFTDENGSYDFPSLPSGNYQVWVGSAAKQTVRLSPSGASQEFKVRLGPDFMNQTTASTLWAQIPANEGKKTEVMKNCVNCHTAWRLLKWEPSSAQDWTKIVDQMAGRPTPAEDPYALKLTPEQKKDITAFLAETIHPKLKDTIVAQAMVRPKGEAARAVFTEWDTPGAMEQRVVPQPDSDFVPARSNGHIGSWTDSKGIIWYATNGVGRLDPRTGEFQEWKYPGARGGFHDIMGDDKGALWVTTLGQNKVLRFDTKTHEYTTWDVPADMGRFPHTGAFDRLGRYWLTTIGGENSGVARLQPLTGEFTKFSVPAKFAGTYSIEVDKNQNVWFTELNADKLAKIDANGKLTEYTVPTPKSLPRRMQLDSKGRVWLTLSRASKIAMFDPATEKFTEYDPGIPNGFPYMLKVDKFDKVWFDDIQGNMIGQFDPVTKKFVLYLLPTPESFARDASFDYTTDPPSIVYTAAQVPILGRLQVRKR